MSDVLVQLVLREHSLILAEIKRLRAALEESVRLQSHYAKLLNWHDGGHRREFPDADAWLRATVGLDQEMEK